RGQITFAIQINQTVQLLCRALNPRVCRVDYDAEQLEADQCEEQLARLLTRMDHRAPLGRTLESVGHTRVCGVSDVKVGGRVARYRVQSFWFLVFGFWFWFLIACNVTRNQKLETRNSEPLNTELVFLRQRTLGYEPGVNVRL